MKSINLFLGLTFFLICNLQAQINYSTINSYFTENVNIYSRIPLSFLSPEKKYLLKVYDLNGNLITENKFLPHYIGFPREIYETDFTLIDKNVNFDAEYLNGVLVNFKTKEKYLEEPRGIFINGLNIKPSRDQRNQFLFDIDGNFSTLKIPVGYSIKQNDFKFPLHVSNNSTNKTNFIKKNGELLFSKDLDFSTSFNNGRSLIQETESTDGWWRRNFINELGEKTSESNISTAGEYKFGFCKVVEQTEMKEKTDWKGVLNYVPGVNTKKTIIKSIEYIIDLNGKKVIEIPSGYNIDIIEKNLFKYTKEKVVVNNPSGKILKRLVPEVSKTLNIEDTKIKENSEYGIMDEKGNVLYTSYKPFEIYAGYPLDETILIETYLGNMYGPIKYEVLIKGEKPYDLKLKKEEVSKSNNFGFWDGMLITKNPNSPINCNSCPNQFGFVNIKGELVIPHKYKSVTNFAKDRALVINNNMEYELINKNGDLLKALK